MAFLAQVGRIKTLKARAAAKPLVKRTRKVHNGPPVMPARPDRQSYHEPRVLLERVRPRVHNVLRRLEVPDGEAEALIHDTLLALVYKWHQISDHEIWLLKTLESRCQRLYGGSRRAAS